MLLRGFIDAIMMRSQQAMAFHAAGYLPPEHYNQILVGARDHHDLLRRNAVHDRPDEFRGAAATRRADGPFPTWNSVSFWLTASGALSVNLSLGHRRVLPGRLAALPALVRNNLFPRRGRRLLSVGASNLRRWDIGDRHQFRDNHPQDTRAGHELFSDARLLLDGARGQSPHCRGVSCPHRDARHAAPGPLPRLPFSSRIRAGGNI